MDLKDIAVISGKPGLYRILKPTRTGVILEGIGAVKTKLMANANFRISILKEISIYSDNEEGSVPLEEIFYRISEQKGLNFNVAEVSNLRDFFEEIVPEYDRERVYDSDIKKVLTWYGLLASNEIDVLQRPEVNEEAESEKDA